MKAKLIFALVVLALSLGLAAEAIPPSCSAFCAVVRCLPDYVCGPYVNSSGQTVCGCHPR
jgi:hypothetical protein